VTLISQLEGFIFGAKPYLACTLKTLKFTYTLKLLTHTLLLINMPRHE
jgi:hypothetical protein